MSMGTRGNHQRSLFVATAGHSLTPRHRFYESLNTLLAESGFDGFVEGLCSKYYEPAGTRGRPSIAPGVYFRMLLVGFFEGIESERGICWRCSDSLSLKEFLGVEAYEKTPEHSSLSRIRQRLDESVFSDVFGFVLAIVELHGLLKGKVAGVDSTYLRADASMKGIVRRDTGEAYKEYLQRLANEDGLGALNDEELRRFDRNRKDKRASNKEWVSPVDSAARIMKLKDGRTRLAYKAEHVVDMETGAIISAELMTATTADSASLHQSLDSAEANMERAKEHAAGPGDDDDQDEPPAFVANHVGAGDEPRIKEVVADKGYHKAQTIKTLRDGSRRTYIPERKQKGRRKWRGNGGRETAEAVYQNRARVKRKKSKRYQRRRGELIERTFAHVCETGAHRRTRLRGRTNANKRYLIQVAATNLALVMNKRLGAGTPRGLADAARALLNRWYVLWAFISAFGRPKNPRIAISATRTPLTTRRATFSSSPGSAVISTGC